MPSQPTASVRARCGVTWRGCLAFVSGTRPHCDYLWMFHENDQVFPFPSDALLLMLTHRGIGNLPRGHLEMEDVDGAHDAPSEPPGGPEAPLATLGFA